MKQVTRSGLLTALAFTALAVSACTLKNQEAPPLTGPSETGTAVGIAATPDVLTQDGASQALVTVTVRDPNGQPIRNVSLRSEIIVGGVLADFGSLSARNIVTGTDGRATLVYTAPAIPAGYNVDDFTVVSIAVTPIGSDFGNSTARIASIRLVPPGIVVPPADLTPLFSVSPSAPNDHQSVLFDASASQQSSRTTIASYSWNFGDGRTASGRTATHSYNSAGGYVVTLTIADAIGRTASRSQTLDVGAGAAPSAAFTVSPSAPQANQNVNFNASASRPAAGRTLVSYDWNFGDGESKRRTESTTTHDYVTPAVYTVTLTVTDDAGRTATATQQITVTGDNPIAVFTFSPTSPLRNAPVNFNAGGSSAPAGRTIVSYAWDFGDGTTGSGVSPSKAAGFVGAGTFVVTLTVTDNTGKVGRLPLPITVQ